MWYQSKSKVGGLLLGLSLSLPGIAKGLQTGDWTEALMAGAQGLGIVLTTFGVRNALAGPPPQP
jgi:hypothetical protein